MGRPCEYNEEKALDAAMLLFWRQGFAGTSLSELEEVTQMKRQSLYNAFGDKAALYTKCLQRYRAGAVSMMAPLQAEEAGLDDIRRTILANLERISSVECDACMVVKTAFEQQIDDPEISRLAQELAQTTIRLYRDVIVRAQRRGEVAEDSDPEALAQFIFSVAHGLSVLAKMGGSLSEVKAALELALSAMQRPMGQEPSRKGKATQPGR